MPSKAEQQSCYWQDVLLDRYTRKFTYYSIFKISESEWKYVNTVVTSPRFLCLPEIFYKGIKGLFHVYITSCVGRISKVMQTRKRSFPLNCFFQTIPVMLLP